MLLLLRCMHGSAEPPTCTSLESKRFTTGGAWAGPPASAPGWDRSRTLAGWQAAGRDCDAPCGCVCLLRRPLTCLDALGGAAPFPALAPEAWDAERL